MNDRILESKEVARYTVHATPHCLFDIGVYEYEDHYMVDIEYEKYRRPLKDKVFSELDDLVRIITDHEYYNWDHTKPVLISPSDILLDHYIKDRRLDRVPRSLFYYLVK